MDWSRTTLYNPKLNLNPDSHNTLSIIPFFKQKRWLKRILSDKTPLGETGCLGNHFLFTVYLSIQFFDTHLFSHTGSQAAFGYLLLTMQHLCDLLDAMPCHCSPSASHPTPYLGKQRISLGVAIILSMCLCPHT